MTRFDKIYLHIKNPLESTYPLLITGREKVGIKKLKNPQAFTDYSHTIDDVYENLEGYIPTNLEDYNPTKKRKVLVVFDMIADMEPSKRIRPHSY